MKFTGRIREPEKLTASFPALKLPLSGGYEEGYADGRTAGYTEGEQAVRAEAEAHNAAILTDCNAVLPDKGAETADTLDQVPQRIEEIKSYADGYDVGIEDGKQAEYDRFWDAIQENGNRKNYTRMFCSRAWNDETFKPKYNMQPTTSREMLQYTMITNGDVVRRIDFSVSDTGRNLFYSSAFVNLPAIDLRNATTLYSCFESASTLQSIELLTVSEKCTNYNAAFNNCTKLVEIRFAGAIAANIGFIQCGLLSTESVQSIIDHLKDLTGQTAQTITFHKDVGNKLTQAQKDTIAAKNWTLVY